MVAPAAAVLPMGTGKARPSICHLPSIDRRPSVMLVNCIEESQFSHNRFGKMFYKQTKRFLGNILKPLGQDQLPKPVSKPMSLILPKSKGLGSKV